MVGEGKDTFMVSSTRFWILSGERVSTCMAWAIPPASVISLATVLMVDCLEFGSGGKGEVVVASLVVLAATTTTICQYQNA